MIRPAIPITNACCPASDGCCAALHSATPATILRESRLGSHPLSHQYFLVCYWVVLTPPTLSCDRCPLPCPHRWVLRCSACGCICRDTRRLFCPDCGNGTTLMRASLTAASDGSLMVSAPKRFNVRGTKVSRDAQGRDALSPSLPVPSLPLRFLLPIP